MGIFTGHTYEQRIYDSGNDSSYGKNPCLLYTGILNLSEFTENAKMETQDTD